MSQRSYFSAVIRVVSTSLLAAVFFTGCLGSRTTSGPPDHDADLPPAPIGPAPARVVSLNEEHNFVVIDFTSRIIPAVGTRVTVYRKDKTVGVVRITEPERSQFATADIVEGEVRVGDEIH